MFAPRLKVFGGHGWQLAPAAERSPAYPGSQRHSVPASLRAEKAGHVQLAAEVEPKPGVTPPMEHGEQSSLPAAALNELGPHGAHVPPEPNE